MYGYIYMILNKINGKKYIGQRKSSKFCHQDKYMGSGKKLKCAYKHYGIKGFEKLLVQYVETREDANKQEEFWIAHYDTTNPEKGYNISLGGEGGATLGDHAWNSGKVMTNEWKENHPNARYWLGKKRSEETKRKISESSKGGNSTSWRKGCKGLNKGKKYDKNPERKESKLFYPGEEPKGWILGRYTPWQGKEDK